MRARGKHLLCCEPSPLYPSPSPFSGLRPIRLIDQLLDLEWRWRPKCGFDALPVPGPEALVRKRTRSPTAQERRGGEGPRGRNSSCWMDASKGKTPPPPPPPPTSSPIPPTTTPTANCHGPLTCTTNPPLVKTGDFWPRAVALSLTAAHAGWSCSVRRVQSLWAQVTLDQQLHWPCSIKQASHCPFKVHGPWVVGRRGRGDHLPPLHPSAASSAVLCSYLTSASLPVSRCPRPSPLTARTSQGERPIPL